MIYTLFLVLILLAAVLMIGIVLIQESKGGGLSSNFSSSNAIMGVRKTTDFIEKATWGLAIAMVLFSIVCAHGPRHRLRATAVFLRTHRHRLHRPILTTFRDLVQASKRLLPLLKVQRQTLRQRLLPQRMLLPLRLLPQRKLLLHQQRNK